MEKIEVLKEAISQGNLSVLERISSRETSLRDEKLNTPLIHACMVGQAASTLLLLQKGAEVDQRGINGSTPLMFACEKGDLAVVQKLVEAGADLKASNHEGSTPYLYAAVQGHLEVLKYLVAKGGLPSRRGFVERDLLIQAIVHQQTQTVQYLLEVGYDPNHAVQNYLPISIACALGHLATVQLLVEKGASVNPPCESTPLYFASINGHEDVLRYLIDKDANPRAWMSSGRIAHILIENGQREIYDKFFKKYEVHPEFPEFFLMQRLICHRFGKDHQFLMRDGSLVEMQGMTHHLASETFLASISEYLQNAPLTPEEQSLWSQVLNIYKTSQDYRDDLDEAFKTKYDIWAFDASYQAGIDFHLVGVVVCRSLNLVLICNRGDKTTSPGIEVYKMGNPDSLPEEIGKILQTEEGVLCLQKLKDNLRLSKADHLTHKPQHSDSCGWATSKLIGRGILYCLLKQNKLLSRTMYKNWTAHDRRVLKNEFLEGKKKVEMLQQELHLTSDQLREEGIIPDEIVKLIEKK